MLTSPLRIIQSLVIGLTLCYLGSCISKADKTLDLTETPALQITSDIDLNITTFHWEREGCGFSWIVRLLEDKPMWMLQLRYDSDLECSDFSTQLVGHQEVLKSIFSKNQASVLSGIMTPSLRSVNSSSDWNVTLAQSMAINEEWADYAKNYPHHKSKKSSNQILVEAFNSSSTALEFKELFRPYVGQLELKSVEKVFALKINDLPFKDRLSDQTFSMSLAYDAGLYYFEAPNKPQEKSSF